MPSISLSFSKKIRIGDVGVSAFVVDMMAVQIGANGIFRPIWVHKAKLGGAVLTLGRMV